MEEIKVGEYVRTIDGYIRKVIQVNKKGTYEGLCYGAYSVDKKYKNSVGISAKKIIKHSPNIIDLIEESDYINGEIVIDIGERVLYLGYTDDNEHYSRISIDESEINSIVTKEQFSNIEYRLEN